MHIANDDLTLDDLHIMHPGKHSFPLSETITASILAVNLNALS